MKDTKINIITENLHEIGNANNIDIMYIDVELGSRFVVARLNDGRRIKMTKSTFHIQKDAIATLCKMLGYYYQENFIAINDSIYINKNNVETFDSIPSSDNKHVNIVANMKSGNNIWLEAVTRKDFDIEYARVKALLHLSRSVNLNGV